MKLSTLISVSSSSIISRLSACSIVSPASAFPPGSSHQSLNSPYPLWVTKISPLELRMTAATTVIVFIMAAKISNPTEQEKNIRPPSSSSSLSIASASKSASQSTRELSFPDIGCPFWLFVSCVKKICVPSHCYGSKDRFTGTIGA